jgi:hypothetical protein
MHDGTTEPFFFAAPTVTATNYCDMLELFLLPQLAGRQPAVSDVPTR